MSNLTLSEEFSIKGLMHEPHFSYLESTLDNRRKVSQLVLQKGVSDLLLIASSGLSIDSVFAGLSEEHIEYIAKVAPSDYKKAIVSILKDNRTMQEVFEIVNSMDDKIGEGSTQNQDRIKKVIRYIKDNQLVFKF